MTFTPKSFTNGDVLPALDLNEMDANDDHVREEANYYHVMAVTSASITEIGNSISVRLYIDGTAIGTAFTSQGDKSAADISLAAISDGIHVLTIQHGATDIFAKTRFYKSPDMDYLSWWVSIPPVTGTINNYTHWIENATVLGHREAKSWS